MTTNVTDSLGQGFEEFVRVVEEGSLSAAARAMALPRPTLSRRLKKLETRLGVRLMHLSTRRLVLTDAGEALYARARRLIAETQETEASIRQLDGTPRGLLRVSVPGGAGQDPALTSVFLDFVDMYQEVELEVITTSAHIDLVADGVDVAIRGGRVEDPNLIARRLVRDSDVLVASPGYIEVHGAPANPKELANHNCILGYERGTRPRTHWGTIQGDQVRVRGRIISNDIHLRLRAAIGGHGIALLPGSMARSFIEAGELTPLLPEFFGTQLGVWLVYVDREFIQPKVRTFVDHVVSRANILFQLKMDDRERILGG